MVVYIVQRKDHTIFHQDHIFQMEFLFLEVWTNWTLHVHKHYPFGGSILFDSVIVLLSHWRDAVHFFDVEDGAVYLFDSGGDAVHCFDVEGDEVLFYFEEVHLYAVHFFDVEGDAVYVFDSGSGAVHCFDIEGDTVHFFWFWGSTFIDYCRWLSTFIRL